MRYGLSFDIPDEVDILLDDRDRKYMQTKTAEFLVQLLAGRMELALDRLLTPLEVEGFLIEGEQHGESRTT